MGLSMSLSKLAECCALGVISVYGLDIVCKTQTFLKVLQIRKLYALGKDKKSVCCILPREALYAAGLEAGDYVRIKVVGKSVVIEAIAEASHEDPFQQVGVSSSAQP